MRSRSVKSFASSSAAALALAAGAQMAGSAAGEAAGTRPVNRAASGVAASPQLADARAWYVVNGTTGEVLAQHDANERVPIASITKLMTVIVALEHLKPSNVVTVTSGAAQVGESRIPLYTGQRISVHDLLEGALIQSANNAADALAAAAAGGDVREFVGWMNEHAQRFGLHDTHFVRPDGLDAPGHVSSARDVALLARIAMHSPIVRAIVRKEGDVIENGHVTVHTWNDLLGVYPGMIGVKTGHTNDAGWCEVGAVRHLGDTIYAVVLGVPTRGARNYDLQRLLTWADAQYRTAWLVRARTYAWTSVPYGRSTLALVATKPLLAVVRRGRPVVERIVAPTAVSLPVRKGQPLGHIEIWNQGKLVISRPLVAGRSVAKPGAGGRLGYYLGRTMHHLGGLFH
jgi:serine-type D-Ala-D-Ala carboxypeptidase (penicillin-binding protein 5/6)